MIVSMVTSQGTVELVHDYPVLLVPKLRRCAQAPAPRPRRERVVVEEPLRGTAPARLHSALDLSAAGVGYRVEREPDQPGCDDPQQERSVGVV